ncbi:hypothetical protein HPP92_026618 [Vanilla planifolia]|uniref:Uncharacterized protein n=1 Tax=Vanilla planifolia TaxID=51239 RepID=A0A835PF81_VANPL|nr:hypothetical protein HPP92_026618 [Vanilla planifolia]
MPRGVLHSLPSALGFFPFGSLSAGFDALVLSNLVVLLRFPLTSFSNCFVFLGFYVHADIAAVDVDAGSLIGVESKFSLAHVQVYVDTVVVCLSLHERLEDPLCFSASSFCHGLAPLLLPSVVACLLCFFLLEQMSKQQFKKKNSKPWL